jgi:hypothetical protein
MTLTDGHQVSPRASAGVRRAGDPLAWVIPPLALGCAIGLVALTYLDRISGGSLFLALFLFVFLVVAALIAAAIDLVRRRWTRAAALLLVPFILALPVLHYPIMQYEYFVLDLMRFYFIKEKYAEVIDKLSPAERASRIVSFTWGAVGMVPSTTHEFELVYDESGEIALPERERSQAWKDKATRENSYFGDADCVTEGHRLSGHYYSVEVVCTY